MHSLCSPAYLILSYSSFYCPLLTCPLRHCLKPLIWKNSTPSKSRIPFHWLSAEISHYKQKTWILRNSFSSFLPFFCQYAWQNIGARIFSTRIKLEANTEQQRKKQKGTMRINRCQRMVSFVENRGIPSAFKCT